MCNVLIQYCRLCAKYFWLFYVGCVSSCHLLLFEDTVCVHRVSSILCYLVHSALNIAIITVCFPCRGVFSGPFASLYDIRKLCLNFVQKCSFGTHHDL